MYKSFVDKRIKGEVSITARKNTFPFSKCSEQTFQKKLRWNKIFLVLSRKTIFPFPENIILFFRRKMKDDLSQKNTWKHHFFFKRLEKMVFPKKIALEYDLSCTIWKDGMFFPENMIFFLRTENERRSFSRNTCKYDIFCIYV